MQKTAQKIRWRDKLREVTNVSGIAAEKFFNKDFLEVMNNLRKADNNIRSIITGKPIEGGNIGRDPISVKQLLKETKGNLNRREYMAAIADLGRFHAKISEVVNAIGGLSVNVDKVHHDFLFKDLKEKGERGEDQRFEHLRELRKRLAQQENYFVKEASMMDFFHNIGTRRGRALAAWEKRYPKIVQKLRDNTLMVLNKSQALYDSILASLQEMVSARAARNVDQYMAAAKNITDAYKKYDQVFKDYYNSEVKPWMDKTDIFNQEVPVPAVPGDTLPGKTEVSTVPETSRYEFGEGQFRPSPAAVGIPTAEELSPIAPAPSSGQVPASHTTEPQATAPVHVPTVAPTPAPTATVSPQAAAGKEKAEEAARAAQEAAKKFQAMKKKTTAHAAFYQSLEAMAGESPIILAGYINKYAKSIQVTDPETSIKLFGISRAIKG